MGEDLVRQYPAGGDPGRINPVIPVDLVIDHSVQVDRFASEAALAANAELEFARNRERYEFLCGNSLQPASAGPIIEVPAGELR